MSRSLLSKQLQHTSSLSCRLSRPPFKRTYANPVDAIASHAYTFHHYFETIHDFTGLPWLYSIPLVTWFFRVPLTAPRFYFAFRRRNQCLAVPELSFHARVVEEQGALKRQAGINNEKEIREWEAQNWEERRLKVLRKFGGAEPSRFMSHETNFDVTNVGVWIATTINVSTLLALSVSNPALSQLTISILDVPQFVPIWLGFTALAFLNTEYYHGNPSSQVSTSQKAIFQANLNPFRWEWTYVPIAAYFCLFSCPHPVILFAISSTAYTFFERKLVDQIVGCPATELKKGPRSAIQIGNMITRYAPK